VDHPKGEFDATRAVWRRASGARSAGVDKDGHIEVAFVDNLIGMRDSSRPDGPMLVFTQAEWEAFAGGARDGEFDLE
jgi:hypothetical protein